MAAKNLHIMMTASADKVTSALTSVEATMTKLKSSTSGMRAALASIVGGANPFDVLKGGVKNLIGEIPGIGPALQGGIAVAESFFNKIRATQKEMAGIGKQATAVGASIEGFSALSYMASDSEAMTAGMFKLSNAVAEASINGGSLADSFEALGLSANQLSGMKTDQQFLKVADAISKVGNVSMRTKLAMDIFGKGAIGIMPELLKGEAGLRKGMKIAAEHGSVISDRDLAAVKQANLAMKQWDATIDAIWYRLAVQLTPVVKNFAESLRSTERGTEVANEAGGKLSTSLLQWKFMAEDAWDFLTEGKLTGPSAFDRATSEVAKFNQQLDEAAKKAKKEQQELEAAAKAQQKITEEQKKQAEIQNRTNAIITAGEGPADKFEKKLLEINSVMALGKLTIDQYDMALGALVVEFDKFNKAKEESKGPELIEFGSSAASSFETRFDREGLQAQGDAQERAVRVLEQIRDAQKDQVKTSKEAAAALRRLGLAKA